MQAKGTWVLLFFVASAMVVAMGFHYALRDIFAWIQLDNIAVLGDSFRLSTLIAASLALILAIFFGVLYAPSRRFVEQSILEFYKVAFPEWSETRLATFTVVIVSVVASLILGVFDAAFSWLTNNNLFIW